MGKRLLSLVLVFAMLAAVPVLAGATDSVTLTLDPNGGMIGEMTTEPVQYTYTRGECVVLDMEEPVREGFAFLGWQSADGSLLQKGDSLQPEEDVLLTAQWQALSLTQQKFPGKYTYDGRFADVPVTHWAYRNIVRSFELGLVNGMSDTAFDPGGSITIVQAVVLTARIHSIYYTGSDQFPRWNTWYSSYVDYAVNAGFVSSGIWKSLHRPITRAQFFQMLSDALPEELLAPVNPLPEGPVSPWTGLPGGLFSDLSADSVYAVAIYRLYQAGIVNGDGGRIKPSTGITRAETAALLTRITDETLRVHTQ